MHPCVGSLYLTLQKLTTRKKTISFVGQDIMAQILSFSSKESLAPVFKSTGANKRYKSIMAWHHYVTMMFAALSGCTSLREFVTGLDAFGGKLNHPGIEKAPPRSTLALWLMQTRGVHPMSSPKFTWNWLAATFFICRTAVSQKRCCPSCLSSFPQFFPFSRLSLKPRAVQHPMVKRRVELKRTL